MDEDPSGQVGIGGELGGCWVFLGAWRMKRQGWSVWIAYVYITDCSLLGRAEEKSGQTTGTGWM
jgi:hypothetical protein